MQLSWNETTILIEALKSYIEYKLLMYKNTSQEFYLDEVVNARSLQKRLQDHRDSLS